MAFHKQPDGDRRFVSRGGEKLDHALAVFALDIQGIICADLGCHVGGFTDCLLQRGAARVHAVDTGYGVLAWKLRRDSRVVVHERTNALHVRLSEQADLIAIDVGWTRQELILPVAAGLLRPGGRIISLIKPHYEAPAELLQKGILPPEHIEAVVSEVLALLPRFNLQVFGQTPSPIRGHGGNSEILIGLQPAG
ncbi:MAG: Hemolysin A [Phycisphaerae bacterium]|nr:Hemolysin A [Phycisphaerae bacterium]